MPWQSSSLWTDVYSYSYSYSYICIYEKNKGREKERERERELLGMARTVFCQRKSFNVQLFASGKILMRSSEDIAASPGHAGLVSPTASTPPSG